MNAAQLNADRQEAIRALAYDPLTGNPADPLRRPVDIGGVIYHLPADMLADPRWHPGLPRPQFGALRSRHDFEYWAAACVRITDKATKLSVPFILNRPQRRLAAALEQQRRLGVPIRLIMLKARQWGGSTLVQMYMAWIQMVHRPNWHSLICCHTKDISAAIRSMYTHMLDNYPRAWWPEGVKPRLAPCEGMANTRLIPSRGCRITLCSAENQDAVRGLDCSMAHLSEVAFWRDSLRHNPVDLIRSVVSGIPRQPLTFVALESTANGVGSYFHTEWQRAVDGRSDKIPFFVPWYEIDLYTMPVDDPEALYASLDDYEQWLWDTCGCTLEAINWYRHKAREYAEHRAMMAEFPSTPDEAFAVSDTAVFSPQAVARLEPGTRALKPSRGEVYGSHTLPDTLDATDPHFVHDPQGCLKVWAPPRPGAQYIVALDIGGRSRSADYSVATVLDRAADRPGILPEVAAQWRGHIDHDLLARRMAALAAWYNRATLVVESNTWETSSEGRGQYILQMLADHYPDTYHRRTEGGAYIPGFHTNQRTKPALIAHLIAQVREAAYIERDPDALAELLDYETHPDGSCGARRGRHDDILMSRAIALWIHANDTPAPRPDPLDRLTLLARCRR